MLITKKSSAFLLCTAFAGLLGLLRPGFVGGFEFQEELIEFPERFPKAFSLFGPYVLTAFFLQDIPRTCFEFEGEKRCYFSYIPASCKKGDFLQKPRPLVVDVHPLSGNPLLQAVISGWKQIAERECLIMMWPSGTDYSLTEGVWNVPGGLRAADYGTEGGNNVTTVSCCYNLREPLPGPDDTLFLKKAIDHLVDKFAKKQNNPVVVDTSRIYITGYSNGAVASLAVAGKHSDTIAGAAIFSGALLEPFAKTYSGVPVWFCHGVDDIRFPYDGMETWDPSVDEPNFKPIPNVGIWSMEQVLGFMSKHNECSERSVTTIPGGIGGSNTTTLSDCKHDASVELVTLTGVGHSPYKEVIPSFGQTWFPVTEWAWDFLKTKSKPSSFDTEPKSDKL